MSSPQNQHPAGAAAVNMVPTSTGAASAIGLVYPALAANQVLDEGVDLPAVKVAIVIGGTQNGDQEWSLLGGRRRQEDYYLQVWVNVEHTTQKDATIRAVELLGVVETELRANPHLNGAVPAGQWAEIRSPRLVEAPGTDSYEAEISFDIRVKARI